MERGCHLLGRKKVDFGALLDQKAGSERVQALDRSMEQPEPTLALGVNIAALLNHRGGDALVLGFGDIECSIVDLGNGRPLP
jgi:hypothetical protein